MISFLNTRQHLVSLFLLLVFYMGFIVPVFANIIEGRINYHTVYSNAYKVADFNVLEHEKLKGSPHVGNPFISDEQTEAIENKTHKVEKLGVEEEDIDGPSQPEMKSFKSVNADNLVNLFTGDFSYSIPLLDVGGYPINIFYTGDVSAETDASWVGFGWNINPGTINRTVRGLPDDFKGDIITQEQNMKPNITWGGKVGVGNIEIGGIKGSKNGWGSLNAGLGMSFNNYLGPSLKLSGNFSADIAEASQSAKGESPKAAAKISGGLSLDSREGLSLSVSPSLSVKADYENKKMNLGVSSSLGYNSKVGLMTMQIGTSFSGSGFDEKNDPLSIGSGALRESVISFAKPSYIPSIRMPVTSKNTTMRFMLGAGGFGAKVSFDVEAFKQESFVAKDDIKQNKPAFGFLYYENAKNIPDAVLDFSRDNDNVVDPVTPIISVPQYSYDIFSVQGEGTGGSIRIYRDDFGAVFDPKVSSKSNAASGGAEIDPWGYFGADLSLTKSVSTTGDWEVGNNLKNSAGFINVKNNKPIAYMRNPDEMAIVDQAYLDGLGGMDLVRYQISGTAFLPKLDAVLKRYDEYARPRPGNENRSISAIPENKMKSRRSQAISYLTVEEAALVGLKRNQQLFNFQKPFVQTGQNRFYLNKINAKKRPYEKDWHIGEINVLEPDGKRYVYGLPVYNIEQKDFTFTTSGLVYNKENEGVTDKVVVDPNESSVSQSPHLTTGALMDGFVQVSTTPAHAHSFLITALLSSDYSDLTGDGISDDDLGTAVSFNYGNPFSTETSNIDSFSIHNWRSPFPTSISGVSSKSNQANFNSGLNSETKDNKGIISIGKREVVYLHSIETKTHIALFKVSTTRNDGRGIANGEVNLLSGLVNSASSKGKLESISLYSKADVYRKGSLARPIKKVHFEYDYSLCQGTPDNLNPDGGGGKLTLKKIWFSYNGQESRVSKSIYAFSYAPKSVDEIPGSDHNPNYGQSQTDRWGTFKKASQNPGQLKNSEYPYALQQKDIADKNASAWLLKRILLPSGGQIEVDYESDDYAYVAERKAATLYKIAGFSAHQNGGFNNELYNPYSNLEKNYIYIDIPDDVNNVADAKNYVDGINQIYFKLLMNMPKGTEWVEGYAIPEDINQAANFGIYTNTGSIPHNKFIYIKLKTVSGFSAVSFISANFMRENLPGQVFKSYDLQANPSGSNLTKMVGGAFSSIMAALKGPIKFIRMNGDARKIDCDKSFARLNAHAMKKFGGGYRVKEVRMKDNLKQLTGGANGQFSATYGQQYSYTTTGLINGKIETISSGVASYEPSIGNEENPYAEVIHMEQKLPMGPLQYGAIENPIVSGLFNGPVVGYSKVTVKQFNRLATQTQNPKSKSGTQVTEFYTAKEFPPIYQYSPLEGDAKKVWSANSGFGFLWSYKYDRKALSQGFLVVLNNMHGKMKSQTFYAANDPSTAITQTTYHYTNTGKNGLNDKVDFVFGNEGGAIRKGNLGIDVTLMSDTREFRTKSNSNDFQMQVSSIGLVISPWIPFPWWTGNETEGIYRAATVTKVVNFHSILSKVVVMDKGSIVSSENLVYDGETGNVVVTRTNNEFDKPIYNISLPAWWVYKGMGKASENLDLVFNNINIRDGRIISGMTTQQQATFFENGDEILFVKKGTPMVDACLAFPSQNNYADRMWVIDSMRINEPTFDMQTQTPAFLIMNNQGKLANRDNVSIRIIRSGKRNRLNEVAGNVSLLTDPREMVGGVQKLVFSGIGKSVINASAVEYKDRWIGSWGLIKRQYADTSGCGNIYTNSTCDPLKFKKTEETINPIVKGLLGNFNIYKNYVLYADRMNKDNLTTTKIASDGFVASSGNNSDFFTPFWTWNSNVLVKNSSAGSSWVVQEEMTLVSSKGQQRETKDAMGIYTSAKYGYNQTLPIAIAKNSSFFDFLNLSFEDDDYINDLTGNVACKEPSLISVSPTDLLKGHTGTRYLTIPKQGGRASLMVYPDAVNDIQKRNFQSSVLTTPIYDQGGLPGVRVSSSNPNVKVFKIHSESDKFSAYCYPVNLTQSTISIIRIEGLVPVSGIGKFTASLSMNYPNTCSDPINNLPTITLINPKVSIYNPKTGVLLCDRIFGFGSVGAGQGPFNMSCEPNLSGIQCTQVKVVVEFNTDFNTNKPYDISCYSLFVNLFGCPSGGTHCPTNNPLNSITNPVQTCNYKAGFAGDLSMETSRTFRPNNLQDKKMWFSSWVKLACGEPCPILNYTNVKASVQCYKGGVAQTPVDISIAGPIIDGWQKMEGAFTIPKDCDSMKIQFLNNDGVVSAYVDDVRIHPYNASVRSYVYDPISLRLVAELDENNYASIYEYDEEGVLIRTKVETERGIKTVNETRSSQQRIIQTLQD